MVLDDANDEVKRQFSRLLPPEITEVFYSTYKEFTRVQVQAGSYLISHNDVVVESPTGSGKTLGFLLPTLAIMKKKGTFSKDEFGALILSPSRELAKQIAMVAAPYAKKLGYIVTLAVGGTKIEKNIKDLENIGGNILIATPGRLYQLLKSDKGSKLKRSLKTVEVLIVDEADRFNESQFEIHLKEILGVVPKQRRTGLFSATQAKEREDLIAFGLRNPKTIKLKEASNIVSPVSLNSYYTVCEAAEKLICIIEFIRSKTDNKMLVFFPSCGGVKYFYMILKRVLTKRSLFALHGHSSQKERSNQIDKFRKSQNGVMLSTDIMSRGIDIEGIDWVIQFEIPKLSSWFVHRAGRTARCGREGNALIVLTLQQTAYVEFVSKHEMMELKRINVPTSSSAKAEQLRNKIIKIACSDREILEAGTRAFVSHIESYVKHDCNVICALKDLDVTGIAHAYGLLRLPKMRELRDRSDLSRFNRSDIETSTIKYANPVLEKTRLEVMAQKHQRKLKVLSDKAAKKAKREKKSIKGKTKNVTGTTSKDELGTEARKRKRGKTEEEKSDFDNDIKLLKKIKKGRLSQKEIRDVSF